MIKKEAKELTIEAWSEIVEKGLTSKSQLNIELYDKIKISYCQCPLCELFNDPELEKHENNCVGCPLKEAGQQCEAEYNNYFEIWDEDGDIKGAEGILKIVKEWKI